MVVSRIRSLQALAAAGWPAAAVLALVVAGCSQSSRTGGSISDRYDPRYGVSSSPRMIHSGPIPKGGGHYKLGQPYAVAGLWYVPREEPGYDRTGIASWYGDEFHGRKTANGEIFDRHALTAAHPTLPLPSYASVTNLHNGRTILVRINDRGPYAPGRIIDLSNASATALGFAGQGLASVRVRYAGRAPLDGNDRRERAFLAAQPWSRGGPQLAASRPSPRWSTAAPASDQGGWSYDSYRTSSAPGRQALGAAP